MQVGCWHEICEPEVVAVLDRDPDRIVLTLAPAAGRWAHSDGECRFSMTYLVASVNLELRQRKIGAWRDLREVLHRGQVDMRVRGQPRCKNRVIELFEVESNEDGMAESFVE
jgi:hypothetical protein